MAEEKVLVDLNAYIAVVERQRNGAFNEAAMLSAALDQARADNEKLKAELEMLRKTETVDAAEGR